MATENDLTHRLLKRFKDVPGVEIEDVTEWMETALNAHGFELSDNVPSEDVPLIMLYAESDGASQIALRTAYYFSYTDRDEAVDKSMIADQYRRLSEELWERYLRKKGDGTSNFGGSRFTVMKRVDRP